MFIEYTDDELNELKKKDRRLSGWIDKIGRIDREATEDLFEALISSVVSQQISNKAYRTVMRNLKALFNDNINPDSILRADREDIRSCGMSFKKTDWIISIAGSVKDGSFDIRSLRSMDDESVIKELVKLPGIGRWTAEMLLIFSLGRKDILSFGDFGIRNGIMKAYGLDSLSKEQFREIRDRLSPHNTLASLYFWAISAMQEKQEQK